MNSYRIFKRQTTISTGILVFLLMLVGGCQNENIPVRWSANQIKADGQIDDWENIPFEFFEDEQVMLGLSNDSTNLYILFRFSNIEWARVIRLYGLTLWINSDGKKDTEFGIRYQGGPILEELSKLQTSDGEEGRREMPSDMRERMMKEMNKNAPTFAIVDNKAEQIVPISEDGASGPSVGYASSEGFFAYEFSVPLEIINADFYGIEMTPGQKIAIGVQWGGMGDRKRPEGTSMRGRGMGGGRGGEGMPAGGRGSGMGGGRGAKMNRRQVPDNSKEQKIWIKTSLATGRSEGIE